MILHVPPGSPWWMFAGAWLLLALHIGGGAIGIVSGAVALTVRKGGRVHRAAGNIFFVAMLIATFIGAVVSPFLPVPSFGNAVGGVFAFYLIATAWATVMRPEGTAGRFETGALIVIAITTVVLLYIGVAAIHSPGTPPQAAYLTAAVGGLCTVCDFRLVRQHGISGAPRIARHLWRMCGGMFVATGSFFLGQQRIMPAFIQGSPVLILLAVAPFGFLVVWMIRVRLLNKYRVGPVRNRPALHASARFVAD